MLAKNPYLKTCCCKLVAYTYNFQGAGLVMQRMCQFTGPTTISLFSILIYLSILKTSDNYSFHDIKPNFYHYLWPAFFQQSPFNVFQTPKYSTYNDINRQQQQQKSHFWIRWMFCIFAWFSTAGYINDWLCPIMWSKTRPQLHYIAPVWYGAM